MPSDSTPSEPVPTYRLGDDIEDHCTRCRGISMHAVSAILSGEVVKVLCRACLSEHKFRHAKGGKAKDAKEKERKKLFDQVLKSSPFYKAEDEPKG